MISSLPILWPWQQWSDLVCDAESSVASLGDRPNNLGVSSYGCCDALAVEAQLRVAAAHLVPGMEDKLVVRSVHPNLAFQFCLRWSRLTVQSR